MIGMTIVGFSQIADVLDATEQSHLLAALGPATGPGRSRSVRRYWHALTARRRGAAAAYPF